MALTEQSVLRDRIIAVLMTVPSHAAKRADVVEMMDTSYSNTWTPDDLDSPKTRPFESNWRNRASFERARMVRDGVLLPSADGNWALK